MNESIDIPSEYIGFVEFQQAYKKIHGYISLPLCLLGVVMNGFIIIVLLKKHMRTTSTILLNMIAICDLFIMIFYFVYALHYYVLHTDQCDDQRYCIFSSFHFIRIILF